MAGLIDSNMGASTQKIPDLGTMQTAGVSNYDPEKRSIDAAKETVSGQLDSLLAKDSPLSQRAMAGATQQSNRRGLVNSSMAAQAGQAALIDAAMPIANADANVYGAASRDNQSASNTALQFNAGSKNQTSQFNAGQANSLTGIGVQGEQSRLTQAAGGDISSRLSAQQSTQAQQQAQQAADIQTGQLLPATTAAQKDIATNAGQIASNLSAQQSTQAQTLATLQGNIQTALQTLQGTQAQELQGIANDNKTLLQTSVSANAMFTNMATAVAKINTDPNMNQDQKTAAIAEQTKLLSASLAVAGAIGDLDLTGLLTFTS